MARHCHRLEPAGTECGLRARERPGLERMFEDDGRFEVLTIRHQKLGRAGKVQVRTADRSAGNSVAMGDNDPFGNGRKETRWTGRNLDLHDTITQVCFWPGRLC
jgi:hypothetical protein